MGITYLEESRSFHLTAGNTSYILSVVDAENFVAHVYFGKKIACGDVNYLLRLEESPFCPSVNDRERVAFLDRLPQEYSTHGIGDFRESCLMVKDSNGHTACGLHVRSHRIYPGKPALPGLPATFGGTEACTTLELLCEDPVLSLEITLFYTAFEKLDVITRSARLQNKGKAPLELLKALSFCVDLEGQDFRLLSLHGAWARERHTALRPILPGKLRVDSLRGGPGHEQNPFVALLRNDAGEDFGEVYGFNLVYSGNFLLQAEGSSFNKTRLVGGINPEAFSWRLEAGESFCTPEAVLVYSDGGLSKMTRTFHDLYRNHLLRGEYKDKPRPVLINNWEATYFDFNTEKLIAIVREASRCGIEMLVMDDGWFGKRRDDNSSLGDWIVNEEKLPGGLPYLVREVNKLGLKFGIWFEPEMISPDSELFRAHPDWCLHTPGRTPSLSRNQLVLDYSRREVREHVYSRLKAVLSSANIEYVKWDMNRPLTNAGSEGLPPERQRELGHRHILGVYELMERLTSEFPHILLENCSGGGARFDPGMLYFSPQIWCSDNTDAIERLDIQKGTALVYPVSAMGAHVSDVPNHTVGRVTPFKTRGLVALTGTFGYELDITRIPQSDRKAIPGQVALYKKYNRLIRQGDYYRLSPLLEQTHYDCWCFAAKDASEVLVTYVCRLARPNAAGVRIRLKGLEERARYRDEDTGAVYSGSVLLYAGLDIAGVNKDFGSRLIHLVRI